MGKGQCLTNFKLVSIPKIIGKKNYLIHWLFQRTEIVKKNDTKTEVIHIKIFSLSKQECGRENNIFCRVYF